MRITLNKWQMWLLFLPYLAAVMLMSSRALSNHTSLLIANLLLVFNLLLAHAYQVYLGISFNRQLRQPSLLYKINAVIPVVWMGVYFLTILKSSFVSPRSFYFGPVSYKDLGNNYIWGLMLIYAAVNYFIINRWFVTWQIKRIERPEEKTTLTTTYLIPIKRLINISLWALVIGFVITFIFDMVSLSKF